MKMNKHITYIRSISYLLCILLMLGCMKKKQQLLDSWYPRYKETVGTIYYHFAALKKTL